MMEMLSGTLRAKQSDCAPVAGKSTPDRLGLGGGSPSAYHKIVQDGVVIERLPVELFVEARARDGWSRPLRVAAKAEWTRGKANTRFVAASPAPGRIGPRPLYEKLYHQRREIENRIKECRLDLFADPTSSHDPRAIQPARGSPPWPCAAPRPAPRRTRPHPARHRHLRHDPPQAVRDRRLDRNRRTAGQNRYGPHPSLAGRARHRPHPIIHRRAAAPLRIPFNNTGVVPRRLSRQPAGAAPCAENITPTHHKPDRRHSPSPSASDPQPSTGIRHTD